MPEARRCGLEAKAVKTWLRKRIRQLGKQAMQEQEAKDQARALEP